MVHILNEPAGTNGAGKSELTNILKHQSPETEIIDADAIARQLNPKDPAKANIEAGRETLRRVNVCIEQGKDFSIETTLGGGNALRQMEKAKQAGFHVNLYYVGLESPELHIDRVAQWVSKGGHHIREADIRRRYHTSLRNLPKAMKLADHSFMFDNTEVYKIKLETEHGLIRFQDPELPRWVKEAVKDWKAEQTQILKDFDQERDRLSKQIQEVRQELTEARESLQPVHDKDSLLRQYAAHAARYDELRPKNILDKVLQPNRDELKQIEETLNWIEKKIIRCWGSHVQ
ncbi:zeta toxin family protein [Paenibacillus sp. Y412MC10]|uniref:zeta toxin family protein n=1 Tax=Geobacillus sp. (strain Y412MC10) TaxID=481743 RepID=UPI0011AB3438|nr:zeta toxin family protein [Paenibacillus sp. Y412MC10]